MELLNQIVAAAATVVAVGIAVVLPAFLVGGFLIITLGARRVLLGAAAGGAFCLLVWGIPLLRELVAGLGMVLLLALLAALFLLIVWYPLALLVGIEDEIAIQRHQRRHD